MLKKRTPSEKYIKGLSESTQNDSYSGNMLCYKFSSDQVEQGILGILPIRFNSNITYNIFTLTKVMKTNNFYLIFFPEYKNMEAAKIGIVKNRIVLGFRELENYQGKCDFKYKYVNNFHTQGRVSIYDLSELIITFKDNSFNKIFIKKKLELGNNNKNKIMGIQYGIAVDFLVNSKDLKFELKNKEIK